MRVSVVRLLPSILVGLAFVSCSPDVTPPENVPIVGTWLSTDESIRLSIEITGSESTPAGAWDFQSQGRGSCSGTAPVDRLGSNVAVQMIVDSSCTLAFHGAIVEDNAVKGLLSGTVVDAGTPSYQDGTLLIVLHRQ